MLTTTILTSLFGLFYAGPQILPFPGAVPGKVSAGLTFVSSVCGPASPGSNGGASAAINTVGANFLVLAAADDHSGPTVSDSLGNTWTPLTGANPANYLNIWYAQSPVVGASQTFSVAGSGQYPAFCAMAFSGMVTAGVFESGTWSYSGNSTNTVQPAPIAPSSGHNLVITGDGFYCSGQTFAVSSPFSAAIGLNYASGINYGLHMSYLIQSGSASVSPVWTLSPGPPACSQGVVVAAFQGQ